MRVFFAAGPGDIIHAHKNWTEGKDHPNEVSITYSSQVEEFCRDIGAELYMVSQHGEKRLSRDGSFILEHRPKPLPGSSGLRFHLSELLYGLSLLVTAVRFKTDRAIISSGSTHYFMLLLFRLAGIRVVALLHNCLWPSGFPPTRTPQRVISWFDSLFFRFGSSATIGVSPECIRQVKRITKGKHGPVYQIRAQYNPSTFANVPTAPPHDRAPFQINFVGRITRDKGVFDVLKIAKKVESKAPNRVRWGIYGSGPDLAELRHCATCMGLDSVVSIPGRISPNNLRELHAMSHMSIVPTKSTFAEGLAQTAVESILSNRPVISSSVTPALEVLRSACVEAVVDDIDSYAEAVLRVIDDPAYYKALCDACAHYHKPFYDRRMGLAAVLKEATG